MLGLEQDETRDEALWKSLGRVARMFYGRSPVGVVLRRTDGGPAPEVVQAGRVTIDAGRREVRVDDGAVELTTKEFDLLKFLAERPGLALSRQQILDGVWGYDWYGDARTVDVHIAQVRKKLGDAVEIKTVRGVGYRLES